MVFRDIASPKSTTTTVKIMPQHTEAVIPLARATAANSSSVNPEQFWKGSGGDSASIINFLHFANKLANIFVAPVGKVLAYGRFLRWDCNIFHSQGRDIVGWGLLLFTITIIK